MSTHIDDSAAVDQILTAMKNDVGQLSSASRWLVNRSAVFSKAAGPSLELATFFSMLHLWAAQNLDMAAEVYRALERIEAGLDDSKGGIEPGSPGDRPPL